MAPVSLKTLERRRILAAKTVSAEKAEVVATSSAKSVSPKTGDSAGFSLAAAAMSVLAAISAAFAALRRRED